MKGAKSSRIRPEASSVGKFCSDRSYLLKGSPVIGKGNERLCFEHPDDPDKLIKIVYNGAVSRNQNDIEERYFRYLKRKKTDLRHLSDFYGKVSTDIGDGLVFEKITNPDGTLALTLEDAISKHLLSIVEIKRLIGELYRYMFHNNIVFADISTVNILCRETDNGGLSLVVIDGIGSRYNNYKLWLYVHLPFYAKYKVYKQFSKLWRIIEERFTKKPVPSTTDALQTLPLLTK